LFLPCSRLLRCRPTRQGFLRPPPTLAFSAFHDVDHLGLLRLWRRNDFIALLLRLDHAHQVCRDTRRDIFSGFEVRG